MHRSSLIHFFILVNFTFHCSIFMINNLIYISQFLFFSSTANTLFKGSVLFMCIMALTFISRDVF